MKHLSKMMMILFFAVSLFLIPTTNYAEDYPQHLYGNSQIVLVYGRMGYGTYVDKTSVVSEYYNPPYYRLAANVLTYNIDKGTLYKNQNCTLQLRYINWCHLQWWRCPLIRPPKL